MPDLNSPLPSLISRRSAGRLLLTAALTLTLALALAACTFGETSYRIGAVHPLTGDGASYGDPVERVIERAVQDINQQWAADNRHLELVMADGKCTQADALAAAQRLVEDSRVKIIYGGTCSDETLGMAPYTEANQVLLLSPLSESSVISGVGDYVFRNIPSNSAHAQVMAPLLLDQGFRRFALFTNDTAFAQDLRSWYQLLLPNGGGQIVADEVVPSGQGDYTAEVGRILAANPDLVIVLPQTIPDIDYLLTPLRDAGYSGPGATSLVAVQDAIDQYADLLEDFYLPALTFKGEGQPDFAALEADTDCNLDYYCATAYDGVMLIAEMLLECGDRNTDCMRDFLYATQNWEGPYYGTISFDENGDIAGAFRFSQIQNGQPVPVQ